MILHTQNGLAVSSTNFRGDNLTFTLLSPPPLPSSAFITFHPFLVHVLPACFPAGVFSEEQAEEAVDGDRKRRGEGLPQSAGGSVWILQRRSEI